MLRVATLRAYRARVWGFRLGVSFVACLLVGVVSLLAGCGGGSDDSDPKVGSSAGSSRPREAGRADLPAGSPVMRPSDRRSRRSVARHLASGLRAFRSSTRKGGTERRRSVRVRSAGLRSCSQDLGRAARAARSSSSSRLRQLAPAITGVAGRCRELAVEARRGVVSRSGLLSLNSAVGSLSQQASATGIMLRPR